VDKGLRGGGRALTRQPDKTVGQREFCLWYIFRMPQAFEGFQATEILARPGAAMLATRCGTLADPSIALR
jgi:hypothetical protein